MKRKSIALLVALTMCLSLLSACGGNSAQNTGEPTTSDSTPSTTEQQPADEQKEQPSQEPEQTEPEESEEPTQEPEPENNAGTEFLALLQEEWNNGFVEGEGPKHTYYKGRDAFIYNGIVYISGVRGDLDYCTFDIASKEFHEPVTSISDALMAYSDFPDFMDGNFYYINCIFEGQTPENRIYNCNGELLNSLQYGTTGDCCFFENGIFVVPYASSNIPAFLLSHGFEKIAEIPAPQHEIEHGLTEDFELRADYIFVTDGTLNARVFDNSSPYLYRLNTDTYEWEDAGSVSQLSQIGIFCGKYVTRDDGVYDQATGELVFEYGELYPAANGGFTGGKLCYFGGDKYLGCKNNEYRWVSLTDLSMSDPLPFPEGKSVIVLNDTYCVYEDSYGWFLWDYNTGTEETIMTK